MNATSANATHILPLFVRGGRGGGGEAFSGLTLTVSAGTGGTALSEVRTKGVASVTGFPRFARGLHPSSIRSGVRICVDAASRDVRHARRTQPPEGGTMNRFMQSPPARRRRVCHIREAPPEVVDRAPNAPPRSAPQCADRRPNRLENISRTSHLARPRIRGRPLR